MSPKNKSRDLDSIINSLISFLHEDILLQKLSNTDIESEVCFDCYLWNDGLIYQISDGEEKIKISPIKVNFLMLLNEIECFINSELTNANNKNYDYKSQLDRLLCIISDIKNKVSSIVCSNTCNDINIVSMLLVTLIQTILILINILENINTLISTDATDCNCLCINGKTFEIFMGIFINSISKLQCFLQDWYVIAVTFFNQNTCVPRPYSASYVPKSYIVQPRPPKPMGHVCPPCTPNNNVHSDCNQPSNCNNNHNNNMYCL